MDTVIVILLSAVVLCLGRGTDKGLDIRGPKRNIRTPSNGVHLGHAHDSRNCFPAINDSGCNRYFIRAAAEAAAEKPRDGD